MAATEILSRGRQMQIDFKLNILSGWQQCHGALDRGLAWLTVTDYTELFTNSKTVMFHVFLKANDILCCKISKSEAILSDCAVYICTENLF